MELRRPELRRPELSRPGPEFALAAHWLRGQCCWPGPEIQPCCAPGLGELWPDQAQPPFPQVVTGVAGACCPWPLPPSAEASQPLFHRPGFVYLTWLPIEAAPANQR